MPRTKNVPRRYEGVATREQLGAAAAPAAAPTPTPNPHYDALQVRGAGASGVTVKQEVEEEEEGEKSPNGQRRDLLALAPRPARVPASVPRATLAAAPAPAPHHDAPAAVGSGGSGLTLVKEEEAEETLGQQRDRLALALAHGPVWVDSHIKVEDSTSGEDTDGDGPREGEEGPGGKGGDGEGDVGPGGEGGLVLLAGAAHVQEDDGGRGGTPRRSTPTDRAARAKRGRGDVAAGDDVPDAPAPKRHSGGAKVGQSGRHGVWELDDEHIKKDTPWLKWRAQLYLPGRKQYKLGLFPTVDDAARAYDAEVRRRGWAHVRPLNFPQPEELAAYARAEERCDE